MKPNEFQHECLTRWQIIEPSTVHEQERIILALAICGEAGELANRIKKTKYGKPLIHEDIESEIGDVLFYLSVLAHKFGLTLEAVMQGNVEKLTARHGAEFDRTHYTGDGAGGALVDVPAYKRTHPVNERGGHVYKDFG